MRAIAFLALAGAFVATTAMVRAEGAAQPLSDLEMVRVCEAASSFAEQRALTLEAAARNAPESVYLTFAPQADGAQTTVQCRVDGQKVVWHAAEAESPAGLLPQLTAARAAEVLNFTLEADAVRITRAV